MTIIYTSKPLLTSPGLWTGACTLSFGEQAGTGVSLDAELTERHLPETLALGRASQPAIAFSLNPPFPSHG